MEHLRLKEILDIKQLRKFFTHFSLVVNLDVALFDASGREIIAVRKENAVCHSAKNNVKCRKHIADNSLRSSELGEPYICACACGLIMCFSPIIYADRLIGSIACGPVLLWDADEATIEEFLEKTKDMRINVDVDKLFQSINSCTSINITSAAQILFMIVGSLTKEHSVYLQQRAKITEQQAKIAELIISQKELLGSKKQNEAPSNCLDYPIEREKELITCIQKGNIEQSKKALNVLLGEIFSFANGNMDKIKVRLFELVAFFSRTAIESEVPMSDIDKIVANSYSIIQKDLSFEEICFLVNRIMEELIWLINRNSRPKNLNVYVSKAIDYMITNTAKELTLKGVSDAVFISTFYLSRLFRHELNTTFSDYLCKIRIEKAKNILKNEKDPRIQEVAEKTGFNDPNYFAKSFKKVVGMSPRDYRKIFL
ncbi:MAG: PocR ligand-binding domain-containing protein [Spirochaetes bacterium]|nr:PocR ligand-binding domain-containing protein [Spirochaetota bacterium]